MSAAPGDGTSPAESGRTDTDVAAPGGVDTQAPAGADAEPDRPAPLTSLAALLGNSAAGGTACSVDGRCD